MRRCGFDAGASAVIPPTFLLPEEREQLLQVVLDVYNRKPVITSIRSTTRRWQTRATER
jgi:dihydrodipicolinate synthase/N-acetylneuraminate lyase